MTVRESCEIRSTLTLSDGAISVVCETSVAIAGAGASAPCAPQRSHRYSKCDRSHAKNRNSDKTREPISPH